MIQGEFGCGGNGVGGHYPTLFFQPVKPLHAQNMIKHLIKGFGPKQLTILCSDTSLIIFIRLII